MSDTQAQDWMTPMTDTPPTEGLDEAFGLASSQRLSYEATRVVVERLLRDTLAAALDPKWMRFPREVLEALVKSGGPSAVTIHDLLCLYGGDQPKLSACLTCGGTMGASKTPTTICPDDFHQTGVSA